MIQPLRRRHRWMTAALAIILPIAFVAGLAVRKPLPATENVPSAVPSTSTEFSQVLFEKGDLWNDLAISTRVLADQLPTTHLAVELQPRVYLKIPDILVYWHPQPSSDADKLPEGSYLLGALAATEKRCFVLPDSALVHDGIIMLYSLAHQKKIAAAKLPTRTLLAGGRAQ
jgi:hypothetical protein